MNRVRRLSIAALTVASVAVLPAVAISPAHATSIDASGVTLNFGNDINEYIGEDAVIGDSSTYPNIATIGGVQIDAIVTLIDASENSLGTSEWYEELTDSQIVDLNLLDSDSVDVAGCYTNADYVTAMMTSQPYAETDFVSGDLLPGERAQYIDEYYGDAAYENSINTSVNLCGTGDGFVSVKVEFLSGGSPVTLNNVTIFAGDIDSEQYVTLFDPVPTTTNVSDGSELTIDESVSGKVSFISPDLSSDETDPTAPNFVGEATYASVSSLSYTFGLVASGGGGLSMTFDSYFQEEIAKTGVDAAPIGTLAFGAIFVGSVAVIVRRVRRNRA